MKAIVILLALVGIYFSARNLISPPKTKGMIFLPIAIMVVLILVAIVGINLHLIEIPDLKLKG